MRQQMITEEELIGYLREQGVEHVEGVKRCYLEADGHISVIAAKDKREQQGEPGGVRLDVQSGRPMGAAIGIRATRAIGAWFVENAA